MFSWVVTLLIGAMVGQNGRRILCVDERRPEGDASINLPWYEDSMQTSIQENEESKLEINTFVTPKRVAYKSPKNHRRQETLVLEGGRIGLT